jgi:hypothetical protein
MTTATATIVSPRSIAASVGIVVCIAAFAAPVSGSVFAGDEAPPPVDQQVLDEIAALAPPPETDEFSKDDGQALYDQVSALAAQLPADASDDSSSLTGPCGGVAFSYDGDGELIDAAYDAGDDAPPQDLVDGGQAFTKSNPFVVDSSGRVIYFGSTGGDGPVDHTYELNVAGIEVASGGDPNSVGNNRNAGVIDMDEELPFPMSFKTSASGSMQSANLAECTGEGYVEIRGNGLLSVAGIVGIVALLAGLIGILFNARPATTWKG